MNELPRDQVVSLAQSLGLSMSPEDLDEVTHRLNAFLDALAPLSELPLETADPSPAPLDAPHP
ncbi:MAG: hypothetical protein C5B48_03080 [Candidatus Rokuibacteriota bacterium]|nr:MAG: hypothetical protein C5B48_03080 [Candidatus Rokubacteria bacterium]